MKTFKEIQAMYPYQFDGLNIGINVAYGWLPLFEQLCTDIDLVLGENKRGFHWTQIKEKFGSARLHYLPYGDELDPSDKELSEKIRALISSAIAKLNHVCIVCGEPGTPDHTDEYTLLLCVKHKLARQFGDELSIWPAEEDK